MTTQIFTQKIKEKMTQSTKNEAKAQHRGVSMAGLVDREAREPGSWEVWPWEPPSLGPVFIATDK